jgi:hypothetical protein
MKVLPASSRFAFLLSAKVIRCPVPTRKSVLIEALNLQRGVVGCNGMFLPLASLLFSLRRCLQTRPALHAENLALRHQLLCCSTCTRSVACDCDLATDSFGSDMQIYK